VGKGFLFSADTAVFVIITLYSAYLAVHAAGYVLELTSGVVRMTLLENEAQSIANHMLLAGPWLCKVDGVPIPGCIAGDVNKEALGITTGCQSNCITGCTDTPPPGKDTYVLEFNACFGPNPYSCVWRTCKLVVWR